MGKDGGGKGGGGGGCVGMVEGREGGGEGEEGKRREQHQEPSLEFVENQEYIYYSKGVINMYILQEKLGEEQVNLALHRFLEDWNSVNGKIKTKTKKYATSEDLLNYFRAVAPDSLQAVVDDLFKKVEPLEMFPF